VFIVILGIAVIAVSPLLHQPMLYVSQAGRKELRLTARDRSLT
jgi:hypothetical protein